MSSNPEKVHRVVQGTPSHEDQGRRGARERFGCDILLLPENRIGQLFSCLTVFSVHCLVNHASISFVMLKADII